MKCLRFGILPIIVGVVLHSTVLAATAEPTINLKGVELKEWPVTATAEGGMLLLSDSPETVPEDGIMYQDTVSGDTRLFFHHVNGTTTPKKIVVLLENAEEQPAHVTVYKYGLGGPGYDYLAVGKKVQEDYVKDGNVYLLEVPEKGSISMISSLDTTVVQPNELVNGMYDFKTDGPVTVKVMMMPIEADIAQFAAQAKVLPPDVAQYRLRGTFEGKDRFIVPGKAYNPNEHGIVALTLADNQVDPYVRGIDATDGTETINYGNYGVVYRIFVPSTPNGKISYFLNPRGGEYAGWLGLDYRHQNAYTIPTPADRMFFGSKTVTDNAYLGTYEGGKSVWLTFSPPGASNLPVKLILVPEK